MYVKVKISYGQKYGQSNSSGSTVKDVKSDISNTTQHQLSVAQFLTVFTKLDLILVYNGKTFCSCKAVAVIFLSSLVFSRCSASDLNTTQLTPLT